MLFLDHRYTREAGVRSLDRKFGAICRAVAVKVAEGQHKEAKLERPDATEGEGLSRDRELSGVGHRRSRSELGTCHQSTRDVTPQAGGPGAAGQRRVSVAAARC